MMRAEDAWYVGRGYTVEQAVDLVETVRTHPGAFGVEYPIVQGLGILTTGDGSLWDLEVPTPRVTDDFWYGDCFAWSLLTAGWLTWQLPGMPVSVRWHKDLRRMGNASWKTDHYRTYAAGNPIESSRFFARFFPEEAMNKPQPDVTELSQEDQESKMRFFIEGSRPCRVPLIHSVAYKECTIEGTLGMIYLGMRALEQGIGIYFRTVLPEAPRGEGDYWALLEIPFGKWDKTSVLGQIERGAFTLEKKGFEGNATWQETRSYPQELFHEWQRGFERMVGLLPDIIPMPATDL